MFPAERRMVIMHTLERRGSVSVAELAGTLRVSEVTIRKDLDKLAEEGLVERRHGGVILGGDRPYTLYYDFRGAELIGEKEAIGKAAAAYVKANDTIIVDTGTTTVHLAQNLGHVENLHCITNDWQIAQILSIWPQVTVTLTGGILRDPKMPLWGPECERSILSRREVDVTFLSASGISLEKGLTNTYSVEVPTKRAMIQVARKVILLIDSKKFGVDTPSLIAPLTSVQTIITGKQAPPDMVDEMMRLGIDVELV